jgi:hypothetical protein
MSFSQKVPVFAVSIAAAALLVAAPASAQTTQGSTMFISNAAGPNGAMMAKQSGPAPAARPSTAAQTQGGDQGSGLMAKAGNQLK